ncbi:MAG: hypothetical protein HYY78_12140 [Betaproteobacteria bacterium]|nr:hypothetical protein [Betaproteobacteria bacterium]
MPDYIHYELQPLADKLRARYPGVRIVWAHYGTMKDGTRQQVIRYQAPLSALKRAGLLTDEMLRAHERGGNLTEMGDAFGLHTGVDVESVSGRHDLVIYTPSYPHECSRIAIKDAKRLLRQIAQQVRA